MFLAKIGPRSLKTIIRAGKEGVGEVRNEVRNEVENDRKALKSIPPHSMESDASKVLVEHAGEIGQPLFAC